MTGVYGWLANTNSNTNISNTNTNRLAVILSVNQVA